MTKKTSAVPVDFLVEDDFTILRWLAERDIITTPKVLIYELDIGHSQIRKRLQILESRNLLEHPSAEEVPEGIKATGMYRITELGKKIASGDITINEMQQLEDDGAFDPEDPNHDP